MGEAVPPAAVHAEGIVKRFGATLALDRVGITVAAGDSHALVGRNGAGKSTLVSVRTGLHTPDAGRVSFQGEPAPAPGDTAAWQSKVACVYHKSMVTPARLTAAVATAQALPEVEFVLDHGGKPPIAAGGREPWAGLIGALAALPNVSCKLSGLVTEADWKSWRPRDVLPYARQLLDAFGPDRALFGSDWPVCTLAGQYADVYALAEQAVAALDPAERAAVLGGNAARIHRLG
ncbi:amidohydrolase family protein [Actinacidiphila sp. ITFR-21]|uniref:amidohydrolase family protein n=1 Tax=Actinacidiphila sp. ITFR-21 TaxID=3075199 RepID=UPI0028892E8E|nr:amidohydrolase family protein [Streptomyces sp. ITFR-21]WNI14809.1 amidohydrolase family protein [Streptomyces sp. ITFR-21]